MIELFRGWLLGIVATALILAVIYGLVPAGKFRSIARFSGGLVLLLAVMGPLTHLDQSWSLSYSEAASRVQWQIDEYREDHLNATREIIIGQTAAYISDIGKELGVECHPVVGIRLEDGIPLPDSVTMDIPLNDELAARIAAELGIGRDRQTWQER